MTKTEARCREEWARDLERFGVHADGCGAVRVIGRFGSRSGLRWSAGDLDRCTCPIGARIRELLTAVQNAFPLRATY